MVAKISIESLKSEIKQKLDEISEVDLNSCFQCGRCSGGCPAADFMDILPNKIVRLAQLGFIDEILEANTIWICVSCITCTLRCPRGVDIAKIMEALRQIVLRKNINHVNINKIDKKLLRKLPQIALVGNCRKFTI